ncbi:MAG: GDSL-type esterase/lipase family protein, partial [Verrucomicrobiota bacterium]
MRKLLSSLLALTAFAALPAQNLQLQKGDHIAFVGGGLADRQQHHGHFETLIHQAHPDHQLVIRNLGFSGDELGVPAHRSDEVPTLEYFLDMKPGQVTTKVGKTDVTYHAGAHFHANVIFAYWGFNESFRGPEGLEAFRTNLAAWLKKHGEADYGQGKPRIVLFSPIANEDMKSRFFDPKVTARNNANLAAYVKAMAEVAKTAGVPFVDLFTPSQELFAKSSVRLTLNGIHVNADGDRALAPVQFKAVFGKTAPAVNEKVRAAVNDKATEWHHRYRTVDQFNIYGGRSRIKYEGVDNATVIGRDLANREVNTANRHKAVWAAAQGKAFKVSDDNLLPDVSVPPNRKEPVPYLPGPETLQHLGSPDGTKVEFIADETTVPDLINPVQMNFDNKGRLWIACWPNYPETNPKTKVFDKLLVLDLDPVTGKVVKSSVFLDGLNCPTGFQFYKDGVILIQSPDIWYVRDTDGDGKADWKERLLTGMDAADSHHETNSICYEPGGAIYLSDGVFHRSQVETDRGVMRNVNGAIYRFEPQTGKLYRHAPYNFANPHGRVFDYCGNELITDATGNA